MRVSFLGTPNAAVPSLRSLAADHEVNLVVTQPDRPRGRSSKPMPPPVKEAGLDLGLKVVQPENESELVKALSEAPGTDVGVVVAYGRILRPDVLTLPAAGFLNVHFSLLPRWRGAAPVARALMAGDTMTGVTIIKLDKGLDTGPVLTAQAIDIEDFETAGALTSRLAVLGARLLTRVIKDFVAGEVRPIAQSDEGLTYATKISSSDRPIDITKGVVEAINRVRGLAPTPGATLTIDGATFKILAARPHDATPDAGVWAAVSGRPVVGLVDGGLELTMVQPPGRTPQAGTDWLHGAHSSGGSVK